MYGTEKKALMFSNYSVVEFFGQFCVFVDEPGLPQHVGGCTFQLESRIKSEILSLVLFKEYLLV